MRIFPIIALVLFTATILAAPRTINEGPLRLVLLPGGVFQMGTPAADKAGGREERPQHPVTLSPFALAATTTTWELWKTVRAWALSRGYLFDNPGQAGSGVPVAWAGFGDDPRQPVTRVSWYDAVRFCNALSEMSGRTPCYRLPGPGAAGSRPPFRAGRADLSPADVLWEANGYRLPTEAEWEYTCRGGSGTAYFWGNDLNGIGAWANSAEKSAGTVYTYWAHNTAVTDGHAGSAPVGSFKPNPFGLYDMTGNVWQWCFDYHRHEYDAAPVRNPRGEVTGSSRAIRGGSYKNHGMGGDLRSAYRGFAMPDERFEYYGFRICRSGN